MPLNENSTFICPPVNGHVGFSRVYASLNDAAVKMSPGVHTVRVFWERCAEVE